jgi:glycosyltransferase involved in cell wall biosynthesis
MQAQAGGPVGPIVKAWLTFGPHLDVREWERQHAAGEVPDRWPYGLDRLAEHGIAPAARFPLHGPDHQIARVVRKLGGGYDWWSAVREPAPAGADVAIAYDERAGIPVAARERAIPVATGVIWATDDQPARPGAADRMARRALQRAAAVWALSSAQLPVLRDEWGIEASRLHHLPFGIDLSFFGTGGEPTPGRVMSAGNDRHRDYGTLIAAMSDIRRRRDDARLSLTTNHPVEMSAQVGERVERRSHRELIEEYLRASVVAIALRPNLHVSGITVTLEAMACRRPVVVTDTPGMSDYVEHGKTGLLVPPGDRDALADAIHGLLGDPDRAFEMGRAGRAAVEQRFTTAAQAQALARIVDAAMR